MGSSIGEQVSVNKWAQCSIAPTKALAAKASLYLECLDNFLIVVTQSCDLVHHKLEDEPYAECIECRPIDKVDGNFTYGKNPRCLHLYIVAENGDERAVEIRPHRMHRFDRSILGELIPNDRYYLSERTCRILIRWLAGRYLRAAFPDEFNNRMYVVKEKLKKKAVKLADLVTGIYVMIIPDKEIAPDKTYHVTLLALLEASEDVEHQPIDSIIKEYVNLMKNQGMDVQYRILKEDAISVAAIRNYRKVDWDHISLRKTSPTKLPADL